MLGRVATAAGLAVHVPRVVLGGAGPDDYTGIALAVAGIVLLGLAFRIALRGRDWRVKLLAAPVCLRHGARSAQPAGAAW